MDKIPCFDGLQDLLAALHLLLSMSNDGEPLSSRQHELMNQLLQVNESFADAVTETLGSDRND